MSINWTWRLQSIRDLAELAHGAINQKRKYSGEPYFVHCLEVANIVSDYLDDEDAIAAAFCHDIKEDVTPLLPDIYTESWFVNNLGLRTAGLVTDLTDIYTKEAYPDVNRKNRKWLEAERLGKVCNVAKTIKLADLMSNTRSIVKEDPGFAVTYLKEKHNLLKYLVGGEPQLYALVCRQCDDAVNQLNVRV